MDQEPPHEHPVLQALLPIQQDPHPEQTVQQEHLRVAQLLLHELIVQLENIVVQVHHHALIVLLEHTVVHQGLHHEPTVLQELMQVVLDQLHELIA